MSRVSRRGGSGRPGAEERRGGKERGAPAAASSCPSIRGGSEWYPPGAPGQGHCGDLRYGDAPGSESQALRASPLCSAGTNPLLREGLMN